MGVFIANKGVLPWSKLALGADIEDEAQLKEERARKIYDVKRATSLDALCAGLPSAFHDFYKYCRETLDFDTCPQYDYLRSLLELASSTCGASSAASTSIASGCTSA